MENHVVRALIAGLQVRGLRTLRFDFGDSSRAAAKLAAAVEWLPQPRRTVVVGYSFGAWVAAEWLRAGGAPDAVALVTPPLTMLDCTGAAAYAGPVLVVAAEYDLFAPPRRVREFAAGLTRAELVELRDADHFFNHGSPAAAVGAWVARTLARPTPTADSFN